ncbi:MAG: IS1595 family transposase [Rubrobacteraceae bacterium]|nr:IS1595 family transposase [Rubrobacteraceae bacterium]
MEDMNLVELIDQFGDEDQCRAYLEELRWPNGVQCPRCDSEKVSRIVKRNQFDCDSCRYQFSVTAGTLFHDSHLPLRKWFLAIYLLAESKKGMSARQLGRTLGTSYKTAWYLAHRIRAAMGDDDQPLLRGIVEVDETFVGGRRIGAGRGRYRDEDNPPVAGVAQRGGEVRLRVVRDRSKGTLHGFIREHVADEAEAIHTDEWIGYQGIGDDDTRHETVNHSAHEYIRADVHTNTVEGVWSLFKRGIVGSYHQISSKHLPAYLDEMEFRFNNRENPFLFRDTLLMLVHGEALPYRDLVEGESG